MSFIIRFNLAEQQGYEMTVILFLVKYCIILIEALAPNFLAASIASADTCWEVTDFLTIIF